MARYCDLDELIETFEERNRNTCNGSLTCLQLLRMLKTVPTADVVPKSEVETLQHKYDLAVAEREANAKALMGMTIELEAMRGAANSYKMHYENAKKKYTGEKHEEKEKSKESP